MTGKDVEFTWELAADVRTCSLSRLQPGEYITHQEQVYEYALYLRLKRQPRELLRVDGCN